MDSELWIKGLRSKCYEFNIADYRIKWIMYKASTVFLRIYYSWNIATSRLGITHL